MDKIKILMVSDDELLLDTLSLLFFKEYKKMVVISQISELDYFEKFLKIVQTFDMVIIESKWYEETLFEKHAVETMVLLSSNPTDAVKHQEAFVLNPFMGIKELYASLNSRLLLNETLKRALNRSTKIVMFYSPSGGVGTTTAALDYCKALSNYGKNVLYINTERLQSHTHLIEGGLVASGHFINQVQKNAQWDDFVIESAKSSGGFDVMLPLGAPLSYLNIELKMLVECALNLKKQTVYDCIVLDAESDFSEDKIYMLERSDQIVLLGSGTDQSLNKLDTLMNNIECGSSDRFHILITNATTPYMPKIKQILSKANVGYTISGPMDLLNEKEDIRIYDYAIKDLSLKLQ